jgi:hypothetical protein
MNNDEMTYEDKEEAFEGIARKAQNYGIDRQQVHVYLTANPEAYLKFGRICDINGFDAASETIASDIEAATADENTHDEFSWNLLTTGM